MRKEEKTPKKTSKKKLTQKSLRVFISATSGDLTSVRECIKNALIAMNCVPVEQDTFSPDHRPIKDMLKGLISGCDAVIHIVGERYGAEPDPEELAPDELRRSFTQIEAELAHQLKIKVYTFLCADDFPYDQRPNKDNEEQKELQNKYRQRVTGQRERYSDIENHHKAETEVLKLKNSLDELRLLVSKYSIGVILLIIFLGIALLAAAGGFWWTTTRTPEVTINTEGPAVTEARAKELEKTLPVQSEAKLAFDELITLENTVSGMGDSFRTVKSIKSEADGFFGHREYSKSRGKYEKLLSLIVLMRQEIEKKKSDWIAQIRQARSLLDPIPKNPYLRTKKELQNAKKAQEICRNVQLVQPSNTLVDKLLEKAKAILAEKQAGKQIQVFSEHRGAVNAVAISPDGRHAASGSSDCTVRIWDLAFQRALKTLTGHSGGVFSVAFSPDGRRLLSGGVGEVKLWDVASGRCLRTDRGHKKTALAVAFSPDGKYTASAGGFDGAVKICDAETGALICLLDSKKSQAVSALCFTPDSKGIVIGTSIGNSAAELWSIPKGRLLWRFGSGAHVKAVSVTKDGKHLITAEVGTFHLWGLDSKKHLGRIEKLSGQTYWGRSASITHQGAHILTGMMPAQGRKRTLLESNDVILFSMHSGAPIINLRGHSSDTNSTAISPEGEYALTGSKDQTVRLWYLGKTAVRGDAESREVFKDQLRKTEKSEGENNHSRDIPGETMTTLGDSPMKKLENQNDKSMIYFERPPPRYIQYNMKETVEHGDASTQFLMGKSYMLGGSVKKDPAKAFAWFYKAAEQGYSPAQYYLGACYQQGVGVKKNEEEAKRWTLAAATGGHVEAQYTVGAAYDNGEWGPVNKEKAYEWFLKAAQGGKLQAQFLIGARLLMGKEIRQDKEEGKKWLLAAAKKGHVTAQYVLGEYYLTGKHLPQNYAEARKWLAKAGAKKDTDALYALGIVYINGYGTPVNKYLALSYFREAGEKGHKKAKSAYSKLKARLESMSPEEKEKERLRLLRTRPNFRR